MTVATYLKRISDGAIIRDSEKESIKRSISAMNTRLNKYFGSSLKDQFIFGSYTRATILPRSMDERSDIDYMVVFKDDGVTPQSYLNRLRKFVENYYPTSVKKQSYPTIKLDLNHITFELVPALTSLWHGYKIPSGTDMWVGTDPNNFNQDLIDKNKEYNYNIKPLVRLMKYWNAQNGYIHESYELEKWIIQQDFYGAGFFSSPELKHCLYQCFENLGTRRLSNSSIDKINRAKLIIQRTKTLEAQQQITLAENELKKLIPDTAPKSLADILYGS